jgi:tetratricopeptide (TPR) repeat protein
MRPFRLSVGVLGIAAALLLVACDKPKEQEAKYTEHGKSLYQQGDLVKASLEFKNALQINPVASEPQYYLGLIAEKQRNMGAALDAFRKAADADQNNFDANLKAGQLVLMSGDADTALSYAEKVITIAPSKADGHALKAAAMLLKNKLPEAEKEAQAALAVDPKNVDATIVLAGKHVRESKPEDALALVQQGLTLNPNSTDLLLLKLKLVYDAKQPAEVEAVLRKLHEIDPANPSYVIDLANQLSLANRLSEAEDVFRQAVAANPNSDDLLSAYAGFLASKEGLDQAIAEISKLAGQSKESKYTFLLEQLYIRANKLADAKALLTKLQQNATAMDDKLQAQVELARITVLEGDETTGLAQLNDVIAQDSGNESATLLRGAIELKNKQYDNAIADARTVLNTNVNSTAALGLLSEAYTQTGEYDLAIDTLRRIEHLAPTDVGVRLRLASLLASKSPNDALDQLDAAMALRPDATELAVQKADYLVRIGQADKAEVIATQLAKDPKFSGAAHRILGETALARADYPGAIEELGKAQTAGEPFADVAPVLVTAYVKAGKTDDAVSLLSDRIAKQADDTASARLLASLYIQKGDAANGERLLRQVIERKPDEADTYLQLAQLLTAQQRTKDAVAILETAGQKFPADDRVQTFSAIAYDTAGNLDAARKLYEQILAKSPNNKIAANNLAALIADAFSSDAKALDRARQLVEQFRNASDPLLVDTLGWVLVRQGNFEDATILLAKATSLAPTNQQVAFHYAMALKGKGLADKAKEAVAKALAGTPDYRGLDEAKALATSLN